MLNALRQGASSLPAKIFFGILVAGFAVWGVEDVFRQSDREEIVAEIGTSKISLANFIETFRRKLNELNLINSELNLSKIDTEQARSLGIHLRVLDGMIARQLYDQYSENLEVWVSQEEGTLGSQLLNNRIQTNSLFHDEMGQFDRWRFQLWLQREGQSEQSYVNELKQQLRLEQVLHSVIPVIPPPQTLAKFISKWRGERRVANFVKIEADARTVSLPSESVLDAHHKEYPERFTSPELRFISFVHFSPKDFTNEVNITENQLQEEYDSYVVDMTTKEQRTVLQMTFEDELKASSAAERIGSGKSFSEVAVELGRGSDVSLGSVMKSELPEYIAKPAFELALGETSNPVESLFGWHLVHITDIKTELVPTFAESRENLRNLIAEELAGDVMYGYVNKFEDLLGGGRSIEEAASSLGLRTERLDGVDRHGQNLQGTPYKNLPGGISMLEVFFNLDLGQESVLTETEDSGYIIARVDRIQSPALRSFATIRDVVVKDWKNERAQELATKKAQKLIEQLNEHKLIDKELGGEHTALVQISDPFTRNGKGSGGVLPFSIIGDLFELNIGEAVMLEVSGGALVVQLTDIQSAGVADQTEQNEIFVGLRKEYSDDILEQLRAALQERFGIAINNSALEAL